MKIKYMDKGTLIEANDHAIRSGWNRTFWPEKIAALPEDRKFPIGMRAILHDDRPGTAHVRTSVMLTENEGGMLDIALNVFNRLPEIEIEKPAAPFNEPRKEPLHQSPRQIISELRFFTFPDERP
jgi:hypothetical protein